MLWPPMSRASVPAFFYVSSFCFRLNLSFAPNPILNLSSQIRYQIFCDWLTRCRSLCMIDALHYLKAMSSSKHILHVMFVISGGQRLFVVRFGASKGKCQQRGEFKFRAVMCWNSHLSWTVSEVRRRLMLIIRKKYYFRRNFTNVLQSQLIKAQKQTTFLLVYLFAFRLTCFFYCSAK